MATAAKLNEDNGGEYKRPDAAAAFKIYDTEIAPKKALIAEKTGDLSDPFSRIKDQCNFPRRIIDFIVTLQGMEDAKRDHNLLALAEGLKVRGLTLPRDLVTMADGTEGSDIIPTAARPKAKLVAVQGVSDGKETDLADAAEDPAPGTGAAAIAAMNESAAEPPAPGAAAVEPAE
jgi:hypothetical protein